MPHKEGGYRAISGRYIVDAGGGLYSHCLSDAGGVCIAAVSATEEEILGRGLAKKIVLSRDGSVRSDAKRSRCFGGGISFNFGISALRFFN